MDWRWFQLGLISRTTWVRLPLLQQFNEIHFFILIIVTIMEKIKKKPGGAQTTYNGLKFEKKTDFFSMVKGNTEYTLTTSGEILKNDLFVGEYYDKNAIYSKFLKKLDIDYKKILSKKIIPDGIFFVKNKVFIIEKKFQVIPGSVDEKLQTCDFKKKQYEKLFNPLGIKVEYYYVLNDFFKKSQYDDVFEYINSVGCKYFFDALPLDAVDL